jgi:hypothetical protein
VKKEERMERRIRLEAVLFTTPVVMEMKQGPSLRRNRVRAVKLPSPTLSEVYSIRINSSIISK